MNRLVSIPLPLLAGLLASLIPLSPLDHVLPSGAWTSTARGEQRLSLAFEREPVPYVIGSQAHEDRWAYFVTRGVSLFPLTDRAQVRRYLEWNPGEDTTACGLNTRGNYVAAVRRVPESFARATHIGWSWQVTQDTPRGRLGERPDDQALQVILIFRWDEPEEYCAVSFAWTRDASNDTALYSTRLPQDSFPRVQVAVRRLRDGTLPPQTETIDIAQAFRREVETHGERFTARSDTPPRLFAVVLFGESGNQRPPVQPEAMSTRSLVRGVELWIEPQLAGR